jgi:hypothetical protein
MRLKNTFIFTGLSLSAYVSPLLMIFSLLTHNWLYSVEKLPRNVHMIMEQQQQPHQQSPSTLTPTTITQPMQLLFKNNTFWFDKNITLAPKTQDTTDSNTINRYRHIKYVEATYGLFRMCGTQGSIMFYIFKYLKIKPRFLSVRIYIQKKVFRLSILVINFSNNYYIPRLLYTLAKNTMKFVEPCVFLPRLHL